MGAVHFDLSSGGAFLCLPSGEYLRQTVSSTRNHSTLNIKTPFFDVFLKYFLSINDYAFHINKRIINRSHNYIQDIKKPAREQAFIY